MIDVVIPEGKYANMTALLCQRELRGMEYKIIMDEDWSQGIKKAKGEFICFMDPVSILSSGYFRENMKLMDSRKNAAVFSSIGLESWDKRIFGYNIESGVIFPRFSTSSSAPQEVKVGYIGGAILRRSVLDRIGFDAGQEKMALSAHASINIWAHGCRCVLNPNTVYITDRMETPEGWNHDPKLSESATMSIQQVVVVWRQGMVGS